MDKTTERTERTERIFSRSKIRPVWCERSLKLNKQIKEQQQQQEKKNQQVVYDGQNISRKRTW